MKYLKTNSLTWTPALVVTLAAMSLLLLAYMKSIDTLILLAIAAIALILIIVMVLSTISLKAERRATKSEQVIELALAQIERLEREIAATSNPTDAANAAPIETQWPWGEHHTALLGSLAEAARRFWKLYDPTDITTAPSNEDVSDWLSKERRISKNMAEAMATILRADGLRTGPRK